MEGSNFLGLSAAAQAMGLMSRAVGATPEVLGNLPTPFIAHVLREGNGHFVVVHKVGRGRLVVADPAEGLHKPTREEFLKAWTGKALLLTRAHSLPPALEVPGQGRRLLALMLPHSRLLLEIAAAALVTTALAYGGALLFSSLVDYVYPSGEVWTLHLFAILALGLAILNGLFAAINTILVVTVGRRVSVHLMFPTLQRLLHLPLSYFDTRRLGDILNRFDGLLGLRSLITQGPVSLSLDSLVLLLSGAMLFFFHWQLALAVVGVLPFMFLITVLARPVLRKMYEETLKAGGKLDGQMVSTLSGIATVKSFGAEETMIDRCEPLMGRLIRLNVRMAMLSIIPRVLNRLLVAVSIAAIYWIGGLMVMRRELSLGQLIFAVTLAGSLFPPFLSILEMVLQIQEAFATLNRASDIVDVEPEPSAKAGVASPEPVRGELRMEDISFHYGHEENALKNFSLAASPGEVVAIVGHSGSGKSTLLKLLQRFYLPQAGRILLDGIDLRDWDLRKLRGAMAMVDQDCQVFAGSILDNLRLAGAEIPVERFHQAIRLVGLASFIEKLPGRFETDVGEAGARLSGGERQRLALARAIARKPRILLLDEATAHLDPQMEREIFARLREALASTTVILATHRISLAHMSDRVVVLGGGQILEQGKPEELLAARGVFAKFSGRADEGH